MEQEHHGSGDNVGGDKIDRQVNIGTGDYIENQYVENKPTRHLTPRPFLPETFLGRDTDLNYIHDKLFHGNNHILLVNGEGGMGKTSLLSRYYHQYQEEYNCLAWVFAEKGILDALMILAIPLKIQFEDNTHTEERLTELLRHLADLDEPCLLIIDNANDIAELQKCYLVLRKCSNFHILLSTRITEFEQAVFYKTEPLEDNYAIELFKTYYPKHPSTEDGILKDILKAIGYNTLVIELLAKNLFNSNRLDTHYSLSKLLHDLQNKGLLMLSQSRIVTTGYHTAGNALRKAKAEDIIAAMYDLGELSTEESALLSVFAVLPAESIELEVLKDILPDGENLEEPVLSLSQKGWLDYNESSCSFKVSPVIQAVTRMKNPQIQDDCHNLINGLISKLNYEGMHITGSSYETATLYTRYAKSVVNSLKNPDDRLATLHERLGSYYSITGDIVVALNYYEAYNCLRKVLYEDYPSNLKFKTDLAVSYSRLGVIYNSLGNILKALSFFEECDRLNRELNKAEPENIEFKNGLAISNQYLGITHTSLGDLVLALKYYEDYYVLEKELYNAHPTNIEFKNGLATSYQYLGNTYTSLGKLDLALNYYTDYYVLEKELYENNPTKTEFKNGLAMANLHLGKTYNTLGNIEKALSYYEEYYRLEAELYGDYPKNVEFKKNLAISYQYLGFTHTNLGNISSALSFYEECYGLMKELFETNSTNIEFKENFSISNQFLGNAHVSLGDLNLALHYYIEYNRLEMELYESFPNNVNFKNGLAISYERLGNIHTSLKDLEKALNYYEENNRLEVELNEAYPKNVEFKKNLAISFQHLGNINISLRWSIKSGHKILLTLCSHEKIKSRIKNKPTSQV